MAKKQKNKKPFSFKRFIIKSTLLLFLIACLSLAAFLFWANQQLPPVSSLKQYSPNIGTEVFSRDNVKIGEFFQQRRIFLAYDKIPKLCVQAFLSAEDADFFRHSGISLMGITRAALKNVLAGSYKQGGSTITQQVAKVLLLSSEKKLLRKIKEILLALKIERTLSKEEILEIYLNEIYLGAGAYGVEAAAQNYFGKHAHDLSIAQMAMIAGLTRAPSRDNPRKSLSNAIGKKDYVLKRMHEDKVFKDDKLKKLLAEDLNLNTGSDLNLSYAPYLVEHVRRYAMKKYGGESVLKKGLKIYTTAHSKTLLAAQKASQKGVLKIDKHQGYRGPLQNIESKNIDQALKTIDQYNSVRNGKRQAIFKALVNKVDDSKKTVSISLSLDNKKAGFIALEDMNWARKPNSDLYWARHKIKKPSQALKKNDLILVKKIKDSAYELYQEPHVQVALLAINPINGFIEAMIGGNDFEKSEFNRAIQAKRQPGSSFKPFVFSAALERDYTAASIIVDSPIVYDDLALDTTWKPKNYAGKFHGDTIFRDCLIKSRNIPTIKILQDIGIPYFIRFAKRMGFTSKMQKNLSLALGGSEVSPMELSQAYSVFASGGKRLTKARSIIKITDAQGNVLEENFTSDEYDSSETAVYNDPYQYSPQAYKNQKYAIRSGLDIQGQLPAGYVVSPQHAFIMTHLLSQVISAGTGSKAQQVGRPAAGKTGTTNDNHDAWFVGFTPQMVATVWLGYDDVAKSLGVKEDGGRIASPIWANFMKDALADSPKLKFKKPAGVVAVKIDAKTGKLANENTASVRTEYFIAGTEPQEPSPDDVENTGMPESSEDFFMDE